MKLQESDEDKNDLFFINCHSGRTVEDGIWEWFGWQAGIQGKPFSKPYQLFNLDVDPQETTNVIVQHADTTQELTNSLELIRNTDSQ